MNIFELEAVKSQLRYHPEYGYAFYKFRPDQLQDLAVYIEKTVINEYKDKLVPVGVILHRKLFVQPDVKLNDTIIYVLPKEEYE